MIVRIAVAILALLLLLAPSSVAGQGSVAVGDTWLHDSPSAGQAGSEITVIESDVETDFPLRAVFSLKAESSSDIVDVRLLYVVDMMQYVEAVSEGWADFTPAPIVDAEWEWDMKKASLPPGARVTYWWTIEDADGNILETSPDVMSFDDDRYAWQSLTGSGPASGDEQPRHEELTLFWYEGSSSFAQELLDVCEEGLVRLTEEIGTYPERSIEIYIYASADDLRGAMIFPQEWTGGVAYTQFSTIAIGIPPTRVEWGKRALVHELTHLVVHQATFSPYGKLPLWLDEGLAMYNEGDLEPQFRSRLDKAISEGALISVRSLCSPFSAETEQAYLSYAQSYSLVEYLLNAYGQDRMLELLNVIKQGSTYDEALLQVYGFDMDGLDAEWQATLTAPMAEEGRTWLHPVLIAVLAALALLLVIRGVPVLRKRAFRGLPSELPGEYRL